MELELYTALTKADWAKVDIHRAEMEARLQRTLAQMQRRTVTALLAGFAALAAFIKRWR
jgi:hypothetical protein